MYVNCIVLLRENQVPIKDPLVSRLGPANNEATPCVRSSMCLDHKFFRNIYAVQAGESTPDVCEGLIYTVKFYVTQSTQQLADILQTDILAVAVMNFSH